MGCVKGITHNTFPKQGSWLNKRVKVCFFYDTSNQVPGTIVRDDDEAPNKMIIRLDDGRVVDANECQYSLSD